MVDMENLHRIGRYAIEYFVRVTAERRDADIRPACGSAHAFRSAGDVSNDNFQTTLDCTAEPWIILLEPRRDLVEIGKRRLGVNDLHASRSLASAASICSSVANSAFIRGLQAALNPSLFLRRRLVIAFALTLLDIEGDLSEFVLSLGGPTLDAFEYLGELLCFHGCIIARSWIGGIRCAVRRSRLDLSSSRTKGTAVTAIAGYIALVHKDECTSDGVSFSDVPGCIAAGDTFEEAVANAAEALAGHFALMKADGESIPQPRSFEALRRDPEFADDSADAIVTMVTPRTEMAAAE
jgi:predicted RNase H-like HicB family nuclease